MRYDIEFPPQFAQPDGLPLAAYNRLGLQKGIQTDTNNIQPRIGPGVGSERRRKSVIRASYGLFYDHPLLGLYFLGDASDGSKSGQLLFAAAVRATPVSRPARPAFKNATNIFQGILNTQFILPTIPGYQAKPAALRSFQRRPLHQPELSEPGIVLSGCLPALRVSAGQNFVYAYAQQANLTFEQDLGHGMSFSLGYNFNGGRHLNRPINANTTRGDLLVRNWQAALSGRTSNAHGPPAVVGGAAADPGVPWAGRVDQLLPPRGLNPAIASALVTPAQPAASTRRLRFCAAGSARPAIPTSLTGCVPFSDMDANYSNGSSVYHGLTANLKKRFGGHYEFLASYTWSHAIDDSTDLQSPLAPQDSYFPSDERSTSLFDQRHRLVFSGVYQSGKACRVGFCPPFFSNWTFAPIIEVASGRPFNIITGNHRQLPISPSTSRPNVVPQTRLQVPADRPWLRSSRRPDSSRNPAIGFAAPGTTPTLQALDGNFPRNGGVKPWTVFNDVRLSKRINFGERMSMDLIADMFNIANKYNVADVNPLCTNAGQPTAAYDPRQFQFALKVNW